MSIAEAAYNQLAALNRTAWDSGNEQEIRALLVERPFDSTVVPIRRRLTQAREPAPVLLTGQRGSGKSTELWLVQAHPDIGQRFEVVIARPFEPASGESDLRLVQLGIAAAVAAHLDDGVMAKTRQLKTWVKALKASEAIPPHPSRVSDGKVTIKAVLIDMSVGPRDSADLRQRVKTDPAFDAVVLGQLVKELLDALKAQTGRPTLLILDDGDKVSRIDDAVALFCTNLGTLLPSPETASIILTFPYWLHFDPRFSAAVRELQPIVLSNVKTIDRAGTLQTAGLDFFRDLLGRLVDDTVSVENDVIERAVRFSAGIPREFLRFMKRAFEDADMTGGDAITRSHADRAARDLTNQFLGFTQDNLVRRRLKAVRHSKQLSSPGQWTLLDSLLVVEYTNDRPWYDVHPALVSVVDEWITADRVRLLRRGTSEDDLDDALRNEYLADAPPG